MKKMLLKIQLDEGLCFAREVSKTLQTKKLELRRRRDPLPDHGIYNIMRESENSRIHSLSDYVNSTDPTVSDHLRNVVTASDNLIAMGEKESVYEM